MTSRHVIVDEVGVPIDDSSPKSSSSSSSDVESSEKKISYQEMDTSSMLLAAKHTVSGDSAFICFYNSKSGGQNGEAVGKALREHLSPDCVFDLAEAIKKKWRPEEKLQLWKDVPNLKVLVCGGDGTMGWIFSCIDRIDAGPGKFPLAMMPLGTGNDLSRSFRWGYGFKPRMLTLRFVEKVRTSLPTVLDRWMISVVPFEPLIDEQRIKETHLPPTFSIHYYDNETSKSQNVTVGKEGETYTGRLQKEVSTMHMKVDLDDVSNDELSESEESKESKESDSNEKMLRPFLSQTFFANERKWESYDGVFCNYFSLGVDALAASAFHEHREAHPEKFTGQLSNQLMYVRKGFPAAAGCFTAAPPPLKRFVELKVLHKDSTEYKSVKVSSNLRGIIILNLQSYGGGRDLWGKMDSSKSKFVPPSYNDGLLEIVGVANIFQMGAIMGFNKVGVHAKKMAQAQEIVLKIKSSVHMQMCWTFSTNDIFFCRYECTIDEYIQLVKIDGEPWLQPPSIVYIKRYGQSTCLIPKKHYDTAVGQPKPFQPQASGSEKN